jgi:hypothetical protein
MIYLKDTEDSTRRLLDLINTFDKIVRYKINILESNPIHHSLKKIEQT